MKNMSTGAGLAILGLGIAAHPMLSGLASSATASAPVAAAALTTAASAQAEPTIVWMGVSTLRDEHCHYHRLWSDGRLEYRRVRFSFDGIGCGPTFVPCDTGWVELSPPPGGNGFACRTDINGDRRVDGADLSIVLNAWGQEGGCAPDATYPCLDLGNLAGGVAMK